MFEIVAAAPNEQLNKVGRIQVQEDLEKRFRKALIDEMELNPPILIEYTAVAEKIPQLEAKMDELYSTENLKKDCSLVRIKITVEAEIVNER